jgi:shikimate dehydrogenase
VIVNTTPLGMYPDVESSPDINYKLLNSKHILFDLVYNPELTSFLRKGAEQGCTAIGGLKMLHSQAERAWEIWNDDNLSI